jgi:hypothetical protein
METKTSCDMIKQHTQFTKRDIVLYSKKQYFGTTQIISLQKDIDILSSVTFL